MDKTERAFPLSWNTDQHGQGGMLLIDYFAAQIATGIYGATFSPTGLQNGSYEAVAEQAYRQAFAMMNEREKHIHHDQQP